MQVVQVFDKHLAATAVGQSESSAHWTQVPPAGLLHTGVAEKRVQGVESVHVTQVLPPEHWGDAVEGQSE